MNWGATIGIVLLFAGTRVPEFTENTLSVVSRQDNSDWWSTLNSSIDTPSNNIQRRTLSETNFRIAGIDLHDNNFERILKELGNSQILRRGDASTSRKQLCYESAQGQSLTYLIFESGEINSSFYLFAAAAPWNGENLCSKSKKVSRELGTASGLHLGQTEGEVLEILGTPSDRRPGEMIYHIEMTKKTAPDAFARAKKQHPELTDTQLHEDYDTYEATIFVRARFTHSHMVYLGVSIAETS